MRYGSQKEHFSWLCFTLYQISDTDVELLIFSNKRRVLRGEVYENRKALKLSEKHYSDSFLTDFVMRKLCIVNRTSPVCKKIAFMEILHKTVNLTSFSHKRNVLCISCQNICSAVFLNFLHKVGNSIIVCFLLFSSGDYLWLIDISLQKSCSSLVFK